MITCDYVRPREGMCELGLTGHEQACYNRACVRAELDRGSQDTYAVPVNGTFSAKTKRCTSSHQMSKERSCHATIAI